MNCPRFFLALLPFSTVSNPGSAEVWEPEELDPLPFEDLDRWRKYPPQFSPPMSLRDEFVAEEQTSEAEDSGDNKEWKYYPKCTEPGDMAKTIKKLIGKGKKEGRSIDTTEGIPSGRDTKDATAAEGEDSIYTFVSLPKHLPPLLTYNATVYDHGTITQEHDDRPIDTDENHSPSTPDRAAIEKEQSSDFGSRSG
ncbi:hypothetical protein BS50DRAFT_112479 [Corynespora cassiicola Philippines]|uniref:Uncharacterized protein n=1 Tax=Corynespora cassiicola Philippines TaxID=1448308 RepID=A0A2T2NDI0_CORCC|nr:hypothetical protein BS50DRAFT_112479 [Corynespora cassiicola Philippines]